AIAKAMDDGAAAAKDVGKDSGETLEASPASVTTAGNGGNHLVYGLVGGIAGAIALGGGAYYFMSGGKTKSKKKSKRAVGVEQAPMIQESPAPAAPVEPVATIGTLGSGQYQNMPMYPMGQQAQMTPVPQFYQQVPAYQPMNYVYQYPGVQVATPMS
ncbi:unnamed protein product, partial [Symbiodinium pilosum]